MKIAEYMWTRVYSCPVCSLWSEQYESEYSLHSEVPPWALICSKEDIGIVTVLPFYLIYAIYALLQGISTPQNEFLRWDQETRGIICEYTNCIMKT